MKLVAAAALAAFVFADGAVAAERPRCGVPDYLLFGESPLKRVTTVVATQKRLLIAVPPRHYKSFAASGASMAVCM